MVEPLRPGVAGIDIFTDHRVTFAAAQDPGHGTRAAAIAYQQQPTGHELSSVAAVLGGDTLPRLCKQPQTNPKQSRRARYQPTGKAPEIASASVPDTLAALHVNPETGLTHGEVDTRRKEHGYNEVAEQKEHPVLKFLGKFWGLSAWMLELIMLLSLVLRTLLRSRHCGRTTGRQCGAGLLRKSGAPRA